MEITKTEIRYNYSEDEITQLGRDVARLMNDIKTKEEEKKTVVADFNHQIADIKKNFNKNVDRVNNGFEMREVEARLHKNYLTNEKEYYDPVTGDLLKTEPFEPKDLQRHISEFTDDVKAFESKAKPTPAVEPVVDETSEDAPADEAPKEPTTNEGFSRLEYNEVEQMTIVSPLTERRNGRENSANWKIVCPSAKSEVIEHFIWLFPELRGTFDEVKKAFDDYLIRLEDVEATEAENQTGEGEETSEENPAPEPEKPKRKKKEKYVLRRLRNQPPTAENNGEQS
ncbi:MULTISPECIES: hypothetical protein [unclassified Spirosoma]|uniref:hypothetical protein n=1 Tax=unclassified Spirosoma TaxID=2621999 RepID=UPI000968EDC2|nr:MULTISPECIES: hypothetical protein [unclassified Spirosoma]MBN8826467.1 hypothetical protein [Spirosoma sp.]OJW76440.1 MAG: hypothetical protein BGO59_23285 [Spirosoma sp. 48-14]